MTDSKKEAVQIRYEVHWRLNEIMTHLLTHKCKHTAIDMWKERFEDKIYQLTKALEEESSEQLAIVSGYIEEESEEKKQ